MEADWYIDPLGRYEGRFFDGARWTHQVSDRGTLAFDPDWPPVARGGHGGASTAGAGSVSTSGSSSASFADDVRSTASSPAASATAASTPVAAATAATATAASATVRTSSMAESPARQVAVVSDSAAVSATSGTNVKPTLPLDASVGRSSGSQRRSSNAPEPLVRDPLENEGSGRRWLYVLGGLLLLAGLALALLPRLFGGDDGVADSDTPAVEVVQDADSANNTADTDSDNTADTDSGEAATDDTATADTGDTGDEVAVGAVTIRNGQTVLGDLTAWHGEQAASRDITLPNDADCWFAKRGDVAEQAAFCGPVGVDDQGRTLYDQLALVFDDAGPQVVSAQVDRDSLIPNIAIDQGRELVDRDGDVIVGGPTQAPKRGERVRGD